MRGPPESEEQCLQRWFVENGGSASDAVQKHPLYTVIISGTRLSG